MQRKIADFISNPIIIAHCCKMSGRCPIFHFEISKKFKEPVRTNKIPTPKTKNVAPIVPRLVPIGASSALLSFPNATNIRTKAKFQ